MYAVVRGKNPGIYDNWNDCKENVNGFKGSFYKKFKTYDEARKFFILNSRDNFEIEFNRNVIFVDGAHNKTTGSVAYASVVDGRGIDLVERYDYLFDDMVLKEVNLPVGRRIIAISNFSNVSKQQNNGAELLALIMGLRIANYEQKLAEDKSEEDKSEEDKSLAGKYHTIYSDSSTVAESWVNGDYYDNLGEEKIKWINKLIRLKQKFKGNIYKIRGDDNIADLGFHIKKR